MKPHGLKANTRCCVADGVLTLRDIAPYRATYLRDCAFHRDLKKRADENERAREERREKRVEFVL